MVPYIKITREKPHLTFFFAILFLAKLDSGGKIIDLSDLTGHLLIAKIFKNYQSWSFS